MDPLLGAIRTLLTLKSAEFDHPSPRVATLSRAPRVRFLRETRGESLMNSENLCAFPAKRVMNL